MSASEDLLSQLHDELTNQLLKRVASGDATAADLAVARGLLKDNSITCAPSKDNGIGELERKLAERRAKRDLKLVPPNPADDMAAAEEQLGRMIAHG